MRWVSNWVNGCIGSPMAEWSCDLGKRRWCLRHDATGAQAEAWGAEDESAASPKPRGVSDVLGRIRKGKNKKEKGMTTRLGYTDESESREREGRSTSIFPTSRDKGPILFHSQPTLAKVCPFPRIASSSVGGYMKGGANERGIPAGRSPSPHQHSTPGPSHFFLFPTSTSSGGRLRTRIREGDQEAAPLIGGVVRSVLPGRPSAEHVRGDRGVRTPVNMRETRFDLSAW